MDRFRRILQRHPISDKELLFPKEKKKLIVEKVSSDVRKGVRKGYKNIPTTQGEGQRRLKRASAIKAISPIRSGLKQRKKRRKKKYK